MEYSVICVFAAIGLVFSGCPTLSWSSPELSKLNETSGPLAGLISTTQASWIGSLPMVGGIFGPLLGVLIANKYGRKSAYLGLEILTICGYIICAFSSKLYLFYFARFINGLALSAFFGITPLYVGEMAKNEHRGMLSSLTAIAVNTGILFSYCVGSNLSVESFNLLLAIIGTIFFFIFLLIGVETPNYYLTKNKYEKSQHILYKIRRGSNTKIQKELDEQKMLMFMDNNLTEDALDVWKSKAAKKSILISVGLLTFQQLSGAFAVISYTQQIFEAAGSSLSPEASSIVFGIVQLCACLCTPFILGVCGRKTLLLWSSLVMALSEICLGAYILANKEQHLSSWGFLPTVALGLFIIAYNNGIGTIPTIFLSEIFPPTIKSHATSISVTWCYFLGFVISKYFPQLTQLLGIGKCFVGFGVVSACAIVFTWLVVLETKGKTLRQIQNELSS